MAQSHIPKFGNWDSENVPYTAYFENARRERTRPMINPNDPEQNPELLKMLSRGGSHKMNDHDTVKASPDGNSHHRTGSNSRHRRRGSYGNFTPECDANDRRSERKRSMPKGTSFVGSFSSSTPSHSRHRSGNHNDNTNDNKAAAAIPKFGAWDETDPKSGEGFTMIFNQLQKERLIAAGHYPNGNVESSHVHATCSSIENHYGKPTSTQKISKYCCCLFSSSSK